MKSVPRLVMFGCGLPVSYQPTPSSRFQFDTAYTQRTPSPLYRRWSISSFSSTENKQNVQHYGPWNTTYHSRTVPNIGSESVNGRKNVTIIQRKPIVDQIHCTLFSSCLEPCTNRKKI